MPKIKIKTILAHLALFLMICSSTTGLIVRFSLYTKKILLPDGTTKIQRVVLCGDSHTTGTPQNNLVQWQAILDHMGKYKGSPITILVENQRLKSPWFNDATDQKVEQLLQEDLNFCLKYNEPGSLTMLSFVGMPATFFKTKQNPKQNNHTIINIECRQFLSYTALLNQDALRQNITNPSLIAPFKKLQEQKIKTLTLNDIIKPVSSIDSYLNNCTDAKAKKIFAGIKRRLNNNWKQLTTQWKKELPDLTMTKPIYNLRQHYQQSQGSSFNGYTVYKIANPFEENICPSLITTQFMDEMIEANALWHIIRPGAAETILALIGSTHSGHFDVVHVKNNLAEHLTALGYQHKTSFGLEDIITVDEKFCQKVSKELPQQLFITLRE